MNIQLMGISDEAGPLLGDQIDATKALGWNNIEMRNVQIGDDGKKANIHDLPDPDFGEVVAKLQEAGIQVYCFASTIMNWENTIATPLDVTEAKIKRAIPMMQRLGSTLVRIMSYKPDDYESVIPKIVFEHVREVTKRFLDAGIQPVHENCMNYGGMSWKHTRELLEKCPGLKLVFDTGNPVFNPNRRFPQPWPRQDAWTFWVMVRDYVAHIHIKDAIWDPIKREATYAWPGKGQGSVREILCDAFDHCYNGGISIEPHMAAVFHDKSAHAAAAGTARDNFVEYGRRLEQLIKEIAPGKLA